MVLENCSEGHLDRLNRPCGVERLANLIWAGKAGEDATAMAHRGLTDSGVVLVPLLGKLNQVLLCLGGSRSSVN